MTWQDELRQLDEELAAGRLSAEDYRRQRDDLLSRSASAPSRRPQPPAAPEEAQPNQPGPPAGPPSGPQPVQPQAYQEPPRFQQSGPFPPPFRWDQAPSEPTQVMGRLLDEPGNGPDANGPRNGPRKGPRSGPRDGLSNGTASNGEDAERTQVVPGAPRPGQPGQPPGQPQTGLHGPPGAPPWLQHGDQGPLWGGADLPPPVDTTPAWFKQGPEAFDGAAGSSRTTRILSVVSVVLLLVGISAGAYYFFRPDSDAGGGGTPAPAATGPSGQTPQASTQAQTTTPKPEGPPVAELPGTPTNTERVKTFVDVEAIGYLTNQEIDAYRSTGAGVSRLAISNSGDSRIIVLITQQADAAGAAQTRDALNDLQLRFKLTQRPADPGVRSAGIDNADPGPLRRAHYAAGRYVVRVQVQGIDRAEVDRLYDEVLGTQLDELPADA